MNREARPAPPGQPAPITVFQQNMALLPPQKLPNGENLYRGRQRQQALARLVTFLGEYQPHLVGLCEMWVPGERETLRRELQATYPHVLEGPGRVDGTSLDGGLMLLSRQPIVAHQETVFPACLGEDCLTKKGALHARIVVDARRQSFMDLYLTHLQNPNPLLASPNNGAGSTGREKVQVQLDRLQAFVASTRDGRVPALLMGDLNTDAGDRAGYDDMLARLGRPDDLWALTGDGVLQDGPSGLAAGVTKDGITFNANNTFSLPDEALSGRRLGGAIGAAATARQQQGARLDYFLGYPGGENRLLYGRTQVVRLESSPGRDISDHYGLLAEVAGGR